MRSLQTVITATGLLFILLITSSCSVRISIISSDTRDAKEVSTVTNGFDVEHLWLDAEPIAEDTLEIWSTAVKNLGTDENRPCTYTKITAPCDDCDGEPTRRSIYALRHSLLQPGRKALMEWFDTPAAHTVSARVEEKFDATLEPPWTLLKLDDEEPSESERYSHYQEKIALFSSVEQKRARREERIPVGDFHPAAMKSWFESLVPTHYLGTDDEQLFVGLKPNRKSKSPVTKHLQLTLAIDPETHEFTMFDQSAGRGFVPHFGLRVRELKFQGTFEREPDLDVVVLNHFEYSFRVRLTIIFPSANQFSHWYQDFSCEDESESSDLGEQSSSMLP